MPMNAVQAKQHTCLKASARTLVQARQLWEPGELGEVRRALLQERAPPLLALSRLVEQQRRIATQLLDPCLPVLLQAHTHLLHNSPVSRSRICNEGQSISIEKH